MKILASEVANTLGLRVQPFFNRKTQKDDPKRIVIKAQKSPYGNNMLGVFRKLTGLNPTTVKQSQTSIVAIFTSSTFSKKKVEVPNVKLS
jgi:hypothetical protein